MYIGNSLLIVRRGCCIIKQSILEFSRRVNTMKEHLELVAKSYDKGIDLG